MPKAARRVDKAPQLSRGHSHRWKRAVPPEVGRSIHGGLTPMKARTVPGRMVWVMVVAIKAHDLAGILQQWMKCR